MVAEFVNNPLDISQLPTLDDDRFVSVHPNYLRIWLLGTAVEAALVVVVGVAVAAAVPTKSWIPVVVMIGVLGLIAVAVVAKVVEVKHLAYQVRDHDVSYRSGAITRTVSTVPFVRVQHARLRQGPVQRVFGLASVEVNSAGPDLRIVGLGIHDAEQLKNLVLERAGTLAEDQ